MAHRLSPTNLGFLLNARIAAVHFGYLTIPEFVEQTRQTLEAAASLEKVRGHVLNWYSTDMVAALEPKFVSTVDSGNLAACLWTLKQACLAFAAKPPQDSVLWSGMEDVAVLARIGSGPRRERILMRERRCRKSRNSRAVPAQETAPSGRANELEAAHRESARVDRRRSDTRNCRRALVELAGIAERLVSEMDFSFLYDPRKKVATVGYNDSDRETGAVHV